jgi:hypothetical protein
MLHVGYDINEFHGFEMDSPELKIAEHVSIINKIINISIFMFPKDKDHFKTSKVIIVRPSLANSKLAPCYEAQLPALSPRSRFTYTPPMRTCGHTQS